MITKVFTIHDFLSTLAIDAVIVGLALLIPTMSHLTALPVYQLHPMMLMLLAGMLLVDSRINSLLLALALPFVSYWLVGMPSAMKAVCMAAELATLTSVFLLVRGKRTTMLPTWFSLLLAMACSKGVYYLLKSLLVGGVLVETSLSVQTFTLVGYSLLFVFVSAAVRRLRDKRYGHGKC